MVKHLRLMLLVAAATAAAALGGCSTGQIQGRVVEGDRPAVLVVDRDDARLGQAGVPGTLIHLTLDPGTMRAKPVGSDRSGVDGRFVIDVNTPGAGFLHTDVEVAARREGYRPSVDQLRVPSSRKRVLIVLTPGQGSEHTQEEHILEQTLRLGQPYMD
ncbi:MAG: hypothetical protein WD009_08145 [Phycisphaeraceae bacterium]